MFGWKKVDWRKYGISHLQGTDSCTWTDSEVDRVIYALDTEDIAPVIKPIDSNFMNTIERFLSVASCRQCGQCCQVNPRNPDHPGVMVQKHEIEVLSRSSQIKFDYGDLVTMPTADDIQYLPLPCPFYADDTCGVYQVRPRVCKLYPLSLTDHPDGRAYISVILRCKYGQDIFKYILSIPEGEL